MECYAPGYWAQSLWRFYYDSHVGTKRLTQMRSGIWKCYFGGLFHVKKNNSKKALWDRTCCFGLIIRLRWFSSVLTKIIPKKALWSMNMLIGSQFSLVMTHAWQLKLLQKGTLGSNMLFWSYFFYILVFELACHLERFALEYDYCVSGKISPKRHFGIEHAVLGLFLVWDDSSVCISKNNS